MDLAWLQFLWAVLLVPIGWLASYFSSLRKEVIELREKANSAEVKANQSITENRVREIMKEEMEPIRSDIKSLTQDINKALREFDQKAHDLAMAIATGKFKGGG